MSYANDLEHVRNETYLQSTNYNSHKSLFFNTGVLTVHYVQVYIQIAYKKLSVMRDFCAFFLWIMNENAKIANECQANPKCNIYVNSCIPCKISFGTLCFLVCWLCPKRYFAQCICNEKSGWLDIKNLQILEENVRAKMRFF